MSKTLSTRDIKNRLDEEGLPYSIQHISYLIKQGYFPGAIKGPGISGRWRVPENSVENFIADLKTKSLQLTQTESQ